MPVPDFTVGEVLTSAAMDSIGLWKVGAGSLSLTTSPTNVTDVFNDANFSNYRLLLNVTARSGINQVYMKFIVGTTPASTDYYVNGLGCAVASDSTVYYPRVNAGTEIRTPSTGGLARFSLDIFDPNKATITQFHGTAASAGIGYTWGGQHDLTSLFTGFQLFTTTGTATVEYQVFGYRD